MKKGISLVAGIVLIIAISLFFVLSKNNDDKNITSDSSENTSQSVSNTTSVDANTIEIKNLKFGTGKLTIKKGQTVTWKNEDSSNHTISSDSGSTLNSSTVAKGETYSKKFDEIGTFNYHCDFHSSMTGIVVVEQ